jgi:hypothetical protein
MSAFDNAGFADGPCKTGECATSFEARFIGEFPLTT